MAIDLSGRSLILGLGDTGSSIARYLSRRGLEFKIADSRAVPPGLPAFKDRYPDAEIVTASLDVSLLDGVSRVLVSPGLAHDLPLIRAATERGIPVQNDIELFAHEAIAPVLAVTGSNGKSTVATLLAEMLAAQGFRAPAGGNLGPPALDLLQIEAPDAYILEVSSFQMEAVESLHPLGAAVLNVSADHLDRHGRLDIYAALKEKLLAAAERAVVNLDDPAVRPMGQRHDHAIGFSVTVELEQGYSVIHREGRAYLARNREALMDVDEIAMPGLHNRQNALAALALAAMLEGEEKAALEVLRRFKGLPHRCEWVASRRGVEFVNDSKATNVGATIAALRGLDAPLVLIAGGEAKGASLAALAEHARGRVKAAVVLGAAASELAAVLGPVCEVVQVDALDEAVAAAAALATAGDTVLLSPACSSLDMFTDYRARGAAFVDAVGKLGP